MKPKFRVKLDIGEGYDNFEQYSISLENVIPESLSAECPHCSVYSTMRLDSIVNRASWKFDLICTCTHCEKTIFAQTEYGSNYSGNDEIPPADYTSVISIYPQKTR